MSKCVLLLTCLLACYGQGLAQCCSPGNPVGGTSALGSHAESTLLLFLTYKYGYAGAYFEGARPTDAQFIQSGQYNYLGLAVSYGLSQKLSVELESGYFFNKSQQYVEGIIPEQLVGKGLTDLNLQVKYSLLKDLNSDVEITPGLGVKIPIGSYSQRYQGALLTRDLQPTTGSTDLILSLFLYKGWVSAKFRLFLLNRFELKGQNPDRYEYGNLYANSLFASYSLSPNWQVLAQVRSEIRDRDTRPATGNGIPIENGREKIFPSGSQKIFLIPQISYLTRNQDVFSLLIDLPVYQFYYDKLLASTVAVTLSFSKFFQKSSKTSNDNLF